MRFRKPIGRTIAMIGLFFACTFIIFLMLHIAPGGPLSGLRTSSADRSQRVTAADQERLDAYLGLGSANVSVGQPAAAPTEAAPVAPQETGGGYALEAMSRGDRMVIKTGQMRLLVNDVDTAVDGVVQIAMDYDGYIISSRVWTEEWEDHQYQHASLTIAVPADDFEQAMRRVRGLALQVIDESSSGIDATEEYVDLESRLRNLEATRDRIRGFLDQAQNVQEALAVNRDLSNIEEEIEQIVGRMNYLSQRASYSTLTVYLDENLLPPATPTPTPTPTPIPPWDPGQTAHDAGRAMNASFRFLGDLAIWLGIAVLPFLIPVGLIAWGVRYWLKRRRPPAEKT